METSAAIHTAHQPARWTDHRSDHSAVRAIARASDILRALSCHPEGMSVRQIAAEVDLPRSTVQRILAALDAANLVIAVSPNCGVRLGPALIALARHAAERPARSDAA